MEPRRIVQKGGRGLTNTCPSCNLSRPRDDFLTVKPWHFTDGLYTVCNSCIKKRMIELNWDWNELSLFFQGINIPFVPQEFDRLRELNGDDVIPIYVRMFGQLEYESLDWKVYNDKYSELRKKGKLDLEIPLVRETYFDDLKLRWGPEYDDTALLYLENLYSGLLPAIGNDLQRDQAQKLCKLSWNIDERIRADMDIDKLMASYEKLSKIANINATTIAGDNEFSSMGEVVAWLEKRGWLNPHYSDVKQDIIDELIKSTQTFAQRLYVNETGLSEEIEERILQLKLAATLGEQDAALEQMGIEEEDLFFKLNDDEDLEEYEQDAYDELIIDEVLDADTTRV